MSTGDAAYAEYSNYANSSNPFVERNSYAILSLCYQVKTSILILFRHRSFLLRDGVSQVGEFSQSSFFYAKRVHSYVHAHIHTQ